MAEAPSSKIDHLGIYAPPDQFEKLIEWYLSALSPLNYREIMRIPGAVGLGDQVPDFWIAEKEGAGPQQVHFAFTAPGMLFLFTWDRLWCPRICCEQC
jgi:lactoylglutathione lyase